MVQPMPRFAIEDTPTGRSRARIGKWGRVIMQLEFVRVVYDVTYPRPSGFVREPKSTGKIWRDATKEDVVQSVIFEGKGE